MRDVVIFSPDFRRWHPSVRYAAQFAAAMRATLTGLYVRARGEPASGPPLLVEELGAYAQEELQQAMLAGPGFAEWAAHFDVPDTRWQVAIGRPDEALALAGGWSDLVIVPCGATSPDPAQLLIGAVLQAGAACIALPETSIVPGRVLHAVVAWNGTLASSRAVHAALPLLREAQSVVLLQSREMVAKGRTDALDHLRRHGVAVAKVEQMNGSDGGIGEQLLNRAADYRADLLVMGASERRRLGGRSFGPATTSAIEKTRMPVFLKQ